MKSTMIHVAATGPLCSAAGARLRVAANAAQSPARIYVFVTKSIALPTTPATSPPATTLPTLIAAMTCSFPSLFFVMLAYRTSICLRALRDIALGGDPLFERRLRIVEHLR